MPIRVSEQLFRAVNLVYHYQYPSYAYEAILNATIIAHKRLFRAIEVIMEVTMNIKINNKKECKK